MAFDPIETEIKDELGNPLPIQICDGLVPTYKATVDATGALKVTGGGGGEEHLAGDLIAGAKGGGILGSDGTYFRWLKVDANGELQVDVLSLPGITLASQPNPFTSAIPISAASLPLPTGAATSVNQDTEIASLQLIDDLPHLELDSITDAKGIGMLAKEGSIFRWLTVDASGALQIAIQPTPNTYFNFGDITTSALGTYAIRRTVYTEQTTDAQRSIASANANDTAAGTGARQVEITYFDQTGAGPYTETVTLAGTTYVNTVNTNICFIENIEVISVGSGGVNAGIITLKAAIGGGGATIWTINAGDNRTFGAHHYIATGKTMKVTGISCSHNGTTVGSGAVFTLRSKVIGTNNQPEIQISDFVRLYGQSSTITRLYNSPISVVGPARVILYVAPESSSSIIYRGSFDYNES